MKSEQPRTNAVFARTASVLVRAGKKLLRPTRKKIAVLAVVLVLGSIAFIPLPYFIRFPGDAEPVHAHVRVENGRPSEEGAFLYTTVRYFDKPNPYIWLYAKFAPHYEIQTREQGTGGIVNLEAYRNLSLWMRQDAEAAAVIAAYRQLGRPLDIEHAGVIVRGFAAGAPIADKLQEGDIITQIAGQPVRTGDDIKAALTGRAPGETVDITATRGKKTIRTQTELVALTEAGEPGLGIHYSQVQKAVPPEQVRFNFDDLGGPSVGLLLALEIINQLSDEDLTRGYRIAGTGTIAADGSVGQIGGIEFKLIAADRENADYFLLPKSVSPSDRNEQDAYAAMEGKRTNLQLVPVASLQEAVEFLRRLPEKRSR